jgi:hypothetical protein
MLVVKDPADACSVVGEAPSMSAADVAAAPGLRCRTRITTIAARYQW